MPDSKIEIRPQDFARVNVKEEYEIRYWTNTFGCSETELKNAVNAVGVSTKIVEEFLEKGR